VAPAAQSVNAPAASVAPAASIAAQAAAPVVMASFQAPPSVAAGPKNWEGFISHVRKTRPLLASMLEHGHCASELDQELMISYPPKDGYYREQLQSRVYSEQLLTLSKEYFGKAVKIQIEVREGGESVAGRRERELKDREQGARTKAQNHPMILEAKALFGGELGPIELPDTGAEQHV